MELDFPGVSISISSEAVILTASSPLLVLSTALVGGGFLETRYIVNMHVERGYSCLEPEKDLGAYAKEAGITGPFVGMMTAVPTKNVRITSAAIENIKVSAIATAGLGNLASAGITTPIHALAAGTINLTILIDAALTHSAMVNAATTATEAKVKFLADRAAKVSGQLATGTSTDAVAIATTGRGEQIKFTGPATPVGWLAARCVTDALKLALPGSK